MYFNITTSATKNIDDDLNISIEEGIGDNSTFEETTFKLRLLYIGTTFEKKRSLVLLLLLHSLESLGILPPYVKSYAIPITIHQHSLRSGC